MQVKFAYITCNLKPRSCSLKIHSTATFLKAKRREEGHDFYTEGFPATIKFIRDHFQTRKLTCTAAEVCTEANFNTCACLFTFYRRCFRFKSAELVGNLSFRLLEVGKVWQESQVSGARAGSLFIIFVARERIKLIIEASDDFVHALFLISQKKKQLFGAGYPLVWCMLKQLFTSVLVNSSRYLPRCFVAQQISPNVHLHFGK